MRKYKVLVFPIPASGHFNPILPILEQLNKNENIEIIVYLTEPFRLKVELIGAEFRPLYNFDIIQKTNVKPLGNRRVFTMVNIMRTILHSTYDNLSFITNEIDREKPDLIIYDVTSLHLKWSLRYYEKCYSTKSKKLSFSPSNPLPPLVAFSPFFATNETIYPNFIERSQVIKYSFKFVFDLVRLFLAQLRLCFTYGLKFISPIEDLLMKNNNKSVFLIASVFPELQPRSHLFDPEFYKFVGITVNEHNLDYGEDLAFFSKIIEPLKKNSNSKLVYVSLGTIFNNNLDVFKKVLDAFKSLDDLRSDEIQLDDLAVIVSTGHVAFAQFQKEIEEKNYKVPRNVHLVKSAPQSEILKHADLFITHCGMNSTSESIHFSVPMICIPLSDDQPLVAYRVADELGLGIRLDFTEMTASHIRTAFLKVLSDKSYKERIQLYSDLSRKHVGYKNGSQLILDFLTNSK